MNKYIESMPLGDGVSNFTGNAQRFFKISTGNKKKKYAYIIQKTVDF